MSRFPISNAKTSATPIKLVCPKRFSGNQNEFSETEKAWAKTNDFEGDANQFLIVPDPNGGIASVLFGFGKSENPMNTGTLAAQLPAGNYRFDKPPENSHLASLGWMLGSYCFSRYRDKKPGTANLVLSKSVDRASLLRDVEATFLARDLINTPANDLGADELETEIRMLARQYKARVSVTKGDKLLEKNFPMIYAVGRASVNAPRLIDMKWGKAGDPKVTLVGKGVVFDSGGLNIKSGSSMALMKKDMGGAANTIALAKMIMDAKLSIRLRLLVPAVENAISGNAFRPGDVLASRKGMSVEIGNTDAEGRLVLGDALALGDEECPELMIDMATLTGAARVALGPDLPPFYTHQDDLADEIMVASQAVADPLWRMPLWQPYQEMLGSKVADVNHISNSGFAGSLTAALFLSRFVENAKAWAHFDIYGWTPTAKPWAPVGGEAQGIRALYHVISQHFTN